MVQDDVLCKNSRFVGKLVIEERKQFYMMAAQSNMEMDDKSRVSTFQHVRITSEIHNSCSIAFFLCTVIGFVRVFEIHCVS